MFNKQTLKAMINERLSETAEEIFLLFEQAVSEFQRETEQLEAFPSPQWTKAVVQQEVADVVLHKGHGGYFLCEVKTEPSLTQEDETQMLITNVQSLFDGEELQEQTTDREWPEASGAAGTENCPETSPEPEEEDSDTANDQDASRSDASKETFSCPVCGKCFPRIRGLMMHMRRSHPREKKLCAALYKDQLDREQLTQTQPDADVFIQPLDVHMRAHTEENPRTCGKCGASFPNHSSFIRHVHKVHATDQPFRCSVCFRDCKNRSNLKVHMRIHTGERPFVCSVCGKGFTISGNLKSHLRTHLSEKSFRCGKCDGRYKSKTSLKHHNCAAVFPSPNLSLEGAQPTEAESHEAQTGLDKDNTGSSQCNAETEQMRITQEEEPQTPDMNVDSLNCKDELQPHGQLKANSDLPEEQASGAAETDCPETSPETEEEDGQASRSDALKKAFSCPVCERRFLQIRGLKIHMKKVHRKEKQLFNAVCKDQPDYEQFTQTQPDADSFSKPLNCTVCFRRFKLQSSLDEHMRAHTEENPRMCGKCGASFPNHSSFIRHMHKVHSTDQPFRCTVCYRDCRNRSYLRIHMRIHTGERPYLCSVCGKGFTVSSNLATHLHSHSGNKLFRCEKCGKQYKSKTSLKHHKCAAVVPSPKLSVEGAQQIEVESHEAQAGLDQDNTGASQYEAETEEMVTQQEEPQTPILSEELLNCGNDVRPGGHQQQTNDSSELSPEFKDNDSKPSFYRPRKSLCCTACKRRFPQMRGLKMHMRMVHPD